MGRRPHIAVRMGFEGRTVDGQASRHPAAEARAGRSEALGKIPADRRLHCRDWPGRTPGGGALPRWCRQIPAARRSFAVRSAARPRYLRDRMPGLHRGRSLYLQQAGQPYRHHPGASDDPESDRERGLGGAYRQSAQRRRRQHPQAAQTAGRHLRRDRRAVEGKAPDASYLRGAAQTLGAAADRGGRADDRHEQFLQLLCALAGSSDAEEPAGRGLHAASSPRGCRTNRWR